MSSYHSENSDLWISITGDDHIGFCDECTTETEVYTKETVFDAGENYIVIESQEGKA